MQENKPILIVGLGNPESDYSKTRHNMGFNVINKLAEEYSIDVNKSKFKGLYGQGIIEGQKVGLLKPQTYMNLSGESLIEAMNFYKLSPSDLIIVYDDIDTDPGAIRIRKTGSIIDNIKTENFIRVRVGIGRPENTSDMIFYVIGAIPEEEVNVLDEGTTIAKDAIIEILKTNVDMAMNKFNKKKEV